MDFAGISLVLSVAFAVGSLHALDADHLLAVANLNPLRSAPRTSIAFCSRWALGHMLALLSIGSIVLLFGMAIPHSLATTAEFSVAVLLIALGVWVLRQTRRREACAHAVLASGDPSQSTRKHGSILLGGLHGTAGSATLLALLPMTQLNSPWLGLGYLTVFSLGVVAAMIVFGSVFGGVFQVIGCCHNRVLRWSRALIAVLSITVGFVLLAGQL